MNPQQSTPPSNFNQSPFSAPTNPTAPPQLNPVQPQNNSSSPNPVSPPPSQNPYQNPTLIQPQAQQPVSSGQVTQTFQTAPISPVSPSSAVSPTPQTNNPSSTQSTLLISELRDSLVIMKDGSFRAVIACKSINFDLMSSTEREGVEYSYQGFLNSLEFTTQILVRSQRVDIGPYLEKLSNIRRDTDNMLLGVLMDDYINFIDILSQEANIMDKSFFIIIPYYTSKDTEKILTSHKGFFQAFTKNTNNITKIDRATYDKAVTEINNRVESIISGLFQMGINSVRLNTKELGELYYNFNNPDTAVREPFIDFNKLATTYVKKGDPNAAQK